MASGPPWSAASLDWAEASVAWAPVSCSWAAVASALARTVPLVTVWPTLADTVRTGQVSDEPDADEPVVPPAPDVVAADATMSALTPKRRPYTVLGATVPVATEVAVTLPVAAWAVVYFEAADPPKLGPTTASTTAPTPTRIRRMANRRSFIGLSFALRP